ELPISARQRVAKYEDGGRTLPGRQNYIFRMIDTRQEEINDLPSAEIIDLLEAA
ncbi:hypothetical protein GWI33_012697, partial [Rhynchophorus ferrugineus]